MWFFRYEETTVTSVLLDGEAVILDRNGRHDFDALWNHSRDDEARLLAFDIIELNDGADA